MPKRGKRVLNSDASAIKDDIEAQLEKQRQQDTQAEQQGLKMVWSIRLLFYGSTMGLKTSVALQLLLLHKTRELIQRR